MKTATMIQTASAATSVTSAYYDLGDITNFSVYVDFTGADVVGTLTLECSNDGSAFITVTGSSQAVSTSTDHCWSVSGAGYRYLRVKWVYTSGTGNITAYFVAKETRVLGA